MEAAALPKEQATTRSIEHCLHCDTPLSEGQDFCCGGCEAAYGVMQHANDSVSDVVLFSPFAMESEEGGYTLTLHVDGIHCASCIKLIENALYEQPDVTNARVNMSTKRLSVAWEGKPERADAFAKIITTLGYKVRAQYNSKEVEKEVSAEKTLLRCIAIAGFAMGNLMLLSVGLWSTSEEVMGVATRELFHWVSALIALPTIVFSGRPFFYSALSVLRQGHTNMDVPISLAVILASGMSVAETLRHGEHIYFDSAVMLLFFLLIGRYLDARAKGKARETAQELLSMLSGSATILQDGKTSVIPVGEIREGMLLVVATGENISADGKVTKGASEVDMSLITGETIPQLVEQGDAVFAGTINMSAPIHVSVSKASENSLLSDIVKLMEQAEQGQARYVRLADKAAKLYTPVVHTMGLLTFLGWWLVMGQAWQPSLLIAITVLIITCPCALGLAVPVVQVLASSRLMKQGILLKSGDALERLAEIDMVIFDKTGTLTIGKPELVSGNHSKKQLQLAASIASHSKHPLSQAICNMYDGELVAIEDAQEIAGKGIDAIWSGKAVRLGNREWCIGETSNRHQNLLELCLYIEGEQPVYFHFSDTLRDDAEETIQLFKQHNIQPILLSGDRQNMVEQVAKTLSIDEYAFAMSPLDKSNYLKTLQDKGHKLLMVGDGLNDAPSMAMAHVSMSPASAMDITQNTADMVFQNNKLTSVSDAWQVAVQSTQLVKQNFILAVLYNIVAIPLAVMGYVTPLIAALAMSGSSIIVIANSFRLKRKGMK